MTAPDRVDAKLESATTMDLEQEVRLAVVLYGGVSLAIYINGVAQELLRLVRATAPKAPGSSEPLIKDDDLDPVEKLYRKLGTLLGPTPRDEKDVSRSIRTRFVVDVIAGTSAGGINGIFLGCALARHQFMRALKDLWVTEGDLTKLLNDAESVGDLDGRLEVPKAPRSLLNSRRMYIKLFEALEGMEDFGGLRDEEKATNQSALVDELDLYVTATDLKGLVVKLRLADRIVYERRYRNVFHFVHSTEHGAGGTNPRNDLQKANNGFLAFAARCTSSFPAAFEPMTLDQAIEDLGAAANREEVRDAIANTWPDFYRDYRNPDEVPGRDEDPWQGKFEIRPFGDGGYLDNKPFSHAIEALRQRRADFPIRRVLMYVEPSPQHPELDQDSFDPPDAIENLQLAGSKLPRQETIREDLERVLDRNRQIEHVRRAIAYIGSDFDFPHNDPAIEGFLGQWGKRGLTSVIQEGPTPQLPEGERLPLFGGGYGAYHRLKVSEVTTEMAQLISRVVGLDPESDEATAVRYLVSAWRQSRYLPDLDPELPDVLTENAFLMNFDLSYRLRRLQFTQRRIQVFTLDDQRHADEILASTAGRKGQAQDLERERRLWSTQPDEIRRDVRVRLREMRRALAEVQTDLRAAGRLLRTPSPDNPLVSAIAGLGIEWEHLKAILEAPTPAAKTKVARAILGMRATGEPPLVRPSRLERVNAVTGQLAELLEVAFRDATRSVSAILHPPGEPDHLSKELFHRVRHSLWHQYRRYDYFDMMLFPMLAGTDLGELQPATVLRVSPEDATRLVEERDPTTHRLRCSKLAGTRLGNFGAFLDPIWRRSDILWGRLDAAERIVRGVATQALDTETAGSVTGTHDGEFEKLLGRLQSEIVCQEILELGPKLGREVFVEALLHTRNKAPDYAGVARFAGEILAFNEDPVLEEYLDASALLDVYTRRFKESLSLEPEKQVRLTARGTQVLGRMLDGLSERYLFIRKRFAWWLVVLGRILAGLVEVAVPRSVWELFGIYWINLLYGFDLVLIVAGQFIEPARSMRDFGLLLLTLTFAVDLGRRLLRSVLQRRALVAARWVGGAVAAGIFLIGAANVGEMLGNATNWLDSNRFAGIAVVLAAGLFVVFAWFSRAQDERQKKREAAERRAREEEEERKSAEARASIANLRAARGAQPPKSN